VLFQVNLRLPAVVCFTKDNDFISMQILRKTMLFPVLRAKEGIHPKYPNHSWLWPYNENILGSFEDRDWWNSWHFFFGSAGKKNSR
jgi:hypothetical protein